ncbi:hypothetical protein CYFUS_008567 [Cystobacter fuscus]|uniref:Uncharacterized protein n=1 Tax=Cystobacter fuscus TaxID=43 RepID=A0A250JHL6_9BACT|nr:hypothetical protein CYFUS_008567 [Cystobacter fuscus]
MGRRFRTARRSEGPHAVVEWRSRASGSRTRRSTWTTPRIWTRSNGSTRASRRLVARDSVTPAPLAGSCCEPLWPSSLPASLKAACPSRSARALVGPAMHEAARAAVHSVNEAGGPRAGVSSPALEKSRRAIPWAGPHGVEGRVVAFRWRFTPERVIPAPCPVPSSPPKAQQLHGGQVDGLPGVAPLLRIRSSRACRCLLAMCRALRRVGDAKAGAATQESQGSRACCTCCGFVALWPCR